jgi:hypothetical protein
MKIMFASTNNLLCICVCCGVFHSACLYVSASADTADAIIRVELTGSNIVEDSVIKKHVEYTIRVSVVQARSLYCISAWIVSRRYSNFETLDTELRKALSKDAIKTLPKLPAKDLFRKFDDASVEEKRGDLQMYLEELIANGPVRLV